MADPALRSGLATLLIRLQSWFSLAFYLLTVYLSRRNRRMTTAVNTTQLSPLNLAIGAGVSLFEVWVLKPETVPAEPRGSILFRLTHTSHRISNGTGRPLVSLSKVANTISRSHWKRRADRPPLRHSLENAHGVEQE